MIHSNIRATIPFIQGSRPFPLGISWREAFLVKILNCFSWFANSTIAQFLTTRMPEIQQKAAKIIRRRLLFTAQVYMTISDPFLASQS